MKGFALMLLLALLLSSCATYEDRSRGNSADQDAAWECHKLQSLGWGASRSPCGP